MEAKGIPGKGRTGTTPATRDPKINIDRDKKSKIKPTQKDKVRGVPIDDPNHKGTQKGNR